LEEFNLPKELAYLPTNKDPSHNFLVAICFDLYQTENLGGSLRKGMRMWEHAPALLGIPAAIKATLELLDRLRSGGTGIDRLVADAADRQALIRGSLLNFANDALALKAFKSLHALTNSLFIDLKETFAIFTPDLDRARAHHTENLLIMKGEYMRLFSAQRAGNQLRALQAEPILMTHLVKENMPTDIKARIPKALTWDAYFLKLLGDSEKQCDNFQRFHILIADLHGLNNMLNNYADININRGIDNFNSVMDQLRHALA
jgi:hypothetical protein